MYKIVFIFYVSVHHKPHFRLIRLAGPIFFFRFLFSLAVRMCVPIACTYETYLYGISLRIRFVSLSSHLRLSLRPFIAMCECGQHGSRYILLRLYKALCVLHVRILTSALNGMFAQTFSAIRNNFFFLSFSFLRSTLNAGRYKYRFGRCFLLNHSLWSRRLVSHIFNLVGF